MGSTHDRCKRRVEVRTVVASSLQGWQCTWCQRDVPYTPMRQIQVNRFIKEGKEVRVWCGRHCSTAFYNNKQREKRMEKMGYMVVAKRMDGI